MRRRATAIAVILLAVAACAEPASPASVPPSPVPESASPRSTPADTVGSTAATTSTPATSTATPTLGVLPEGFATTTARVTDSSGESCEVCVWVADTADLRARGLMSVTDLAPAAAMAFVYPSAHTGTFWMKNTVMPLSIAFFAPDGAYLDDFDMEPCRVDPCPTYQTPNDFLVALEAPQGDLESVGVVPGSRLELLDLPCADGG